MWLRGNQFYDIAEIMERIDDLAKKLPKDEALDSQMHRELKKRLAAWCAMLTTLGLTLPVKTGRRFLKRLKGREAVNYSHLREFVKEFHGRVSDDLSDTNLWAVPRERNRFLEGQTFGKDVENAFGKASKDISEASRCLALGRATASVFHLMRVTEIGLQALGRSLNDPTLDPKTNPSWEKILARGDRELGKPLNERSPEWRSNEEFFSTAHANLRAVKDGWRNKTIHVERDYDSEDAEEVWNAVRGFMRQLAKKLSV